MKPVSGNKTSSGNILITISKRWQKNGFSSLRKKILLTVWIDYNPIQECGFINLPVHVQKDVSGRSHQVDFMRNFGQCGQKLEALENDGPSMLFCQRGTELGHDDVQVQALFAFRIYFDTFGGHCWGFVGHLALGKFHHNSGLKFIQTTKSHHCLHSVQL